MIYQIITLLILATFYTFYFVKIIVQKRLAIKTNQMGVGNKPEKVLLIERIMSCATVLSFVFGFSSIFLVKQFPVQGIRVAGVLTGI